MKGEVAWLQKLAPLNQLFVVQISWFFWSTIFLWKKSIWHQNLSTAWSAVACRKQDSCRQQLTSMVKKIGAKFIFYLKIWCSKEISWFGPPTADLEGSTLAITQPHPSYLVTRCALPKKWQLTWSDEDQSADASAEASFAFRPSVKLWRPLAAKAMIRFWPDFGTRMDYPSTCCSNFIPFYLAVSEISPM